MHVVDADDVQRDLSRLLKQVAQGEEVIIESAGNPVAKLVPFQTATATRVPGYWKGKVRIVADFDVLPPALAAVFRGDTP